MHLITYNLLQIFISFVFRHRDAILREFFRSKVHKFSIPRWTCWACV